MSTGLWLYLIFMLDNIKEMFVVFITINILIITVFILYYIISSVENKKINPKAIFYNKIFVFVFIISIILNTFTPSTKVAAGIVIGSKIIDSNTTQILSNIPEKYVKVLELKADSFLKEQLESNVTAQGN